MADKTFSNIQLKLLSIDMELAEIYSRSNKMIRISF